MTDTITEQETEPAEPGGGEGQSPDSPLAATDENHDTDTDTFPREYVEKLRNEAAEHRTKAKDRDALAERLHTALTAATGRLADPSDLPYDQSHLDDPEALTAAIDQLLESKPHLATRKPHGDVGQGAASASAGVDLAGMLRANT